MTLALFALLFSTFSLVVVIDHYYICPGRIRRRNDRLNRLDARAAEVSERLNRPCGTP